MTDARTISLLESALADAQDKASINAYSFWTLVRTKNELLDEVEEMRRDALEMAARRVLKPE